MARARNIKPGFFLNQDLGELGTAAQVLFAGLWCIADREGRLKDRPISIRAQCLPFCQENVDELLNKLSAGRDPFIVRYTVDGARYIQICNWTKHQSPHHTEKASEIPAFKRKTVKRRLNNGELTSDQRAGPESVRGNQESGINKSVNQESGIRRVFVRPTVEEVAAYCAERGNHVDPQRFVDFYASKGWKVGKQPMVDWKAAVRNWEKDSVKANTSDPRQNLPVLQRFLERGTKNG